MTLINSLKHFFKASGGGTSISCGPGLHRHADVYNNKCHPITQKHVGKDKPHNEDKMKKKSKIKKMKLKEES